MSRWLSWLAELQPAMFCEISRELAAEKGISNGGWVTISTARAEIECRALVTQRVPSLRMQGRLSRTSGLPYHWSYVGRVTGDPANELIGVVADPNVSIQESKALTGNIRAGRLSFARRIVTGRPELLEPPSRGELPRDNPNVHSAFRLVAQEPRR